MAEGQRRDAGGIRSLRELIDSHKEAVEYDLLTHGLRLDDLGTERLSWRDLLVIVRQSPPGSALDRAQHPDSADWGMSELLLAAAVDALNVANWQRAGGTQRDYPKPIPRPGVKSDDTQIGKGAVPMDEMAKLLGWDRMGGAA